MGEAVAEKLRDTSNDLNDTDIKIKWIFSKWIDAALQNNSPFARRPRLSLLTLQLCSCFDFRVPISQKRIPREVQSGEKEVRS